MARYVVVDDDNNAGCLTALVIGIIVFCALAYLAMYAFAIALGIILVISGVIGTIITIRNYVVALRDSILMYAHSHKPAGWILPTFLYRWIKIGWETIKGAWSYNWGSIRNFFGKLGFYRFFSFKKWIYLFSGLSVLIFGSAVSLFIIFIHVSFILFVLELAIILILSALVIYLLIGLCMSVAFSTTNYISRLSESYANCRAVLSFYVTDCGYREYINIIREYWQETGNYIKDGFYGFRTLPLFSLKKWIRVCSSIMTVFVGSIMFFVFSTVHIVVLSILFLIFKIISLFQR